MIVQRANGELTQVNAGDANPRTDAATLSYDKKSVARRQNFAMRTNLPSIGPQLLYALMPLQRGNNLARR